ncbi:hypothetical protein WA158_006538 [Blastocystis sp. Blastoise]
MKSSNRAKTPITYDSSWTISSSCWSSYNPTKDSSVVAISSYIEKAANKIEFLDVNETQSKVTSLFSIDHPYPATKIMWKPNKTSEKKNVIATSSDILRLYEFNDQNDGVHDPMVFDVFHSKDSLAPITSFDWNTIDENLIGTCSIDTTCTFWDINSNKVKFHLVAHDKEVYDISFSPQNQDLFATVGGDGTMRLFDLRSLQHCNVIYESTSMTPLLRLSWNEQNSNIIAAIQLDSPRIILVDIRKPLSPLCFLDGHGGCINSIDWAPQSQKYLVSGGDDSNCYIWDIQDQSPVSGSPILSYHTKQEINHVYWSSTSPDHISLCHNNHFSILHI